MAKAKSFETQNGSAESIAIGRKYENNLLLT